MAAHNLSIRTNNALVQTFNVNDLNDLSNVTRAGTLTVAGTTTSPASSVTVNGSTANCYLDATFALGGFTATNGDNTFTAIAHDSYGRKDTNSITVNLPATNPFAYDLNGNMVTNGNEVLVWNDENQLATNYVPGSWKSVFVYDGKLRRRIERDYGWNGSAWIQTNEIHFIYDGNVIIQERDANNLPTLTLTRGNDLSGSLQGAGGIGGLLAMTQNALLLEEGSLSQATCYYHADGNGNVTMLINGSQAVVAKAEYDPFGNFISLSGSKAGVNPFWFSSKPIHRLSGKYDFLYRWYAPQLDRWLNRDPIQEFGGLNLFVFVGNDPLFKGDPDGRLVGALTSLALTAAEIALDECQSCDCIRVATVAGIAAMQAAYISDLVTDAPTVFGAIASTVAYLAETAKFAHDAGKALNNCKETPKSCPAQPNPPPPPPPPAPPVIPPFQIA